MMPWEIIARSRIEELLREAMEAQVLSEVPRPPSRLGAWLKNLRKAVSVPRVIVDDPFADEPLWPRLSEYPYGPRR